ncbi:DNA processing/uptake protein [Williamsoniiplasma somnilux]|uniref:DNA processing/uptake protein n=1 Tax=Williamsoniiplasma somnilux TaxID=215578 RepID=A0A2K8P1D7_9MOLU|nr:DNA-processing protein DprA [Williamsoniiplasma somnilux]ATZ18821.1 DNA processing/uptake protein [Williamsoniiplasma somnilux]
MDNVLLYFSLKYQGNWEKIYTALDKKEKIDHEQFLAETKKIDSTFISIINPLYPISLKNSHKPPFVIFTEGDLNLLANYHQIIFLNLENQHDEYGKKVVNDLCEGLTKENRTLLIGDNVEIDFKLTEKLISNKNKIIFVTKKGIQDFKKINKDFLKLLKTTNYLLVSESYENDSLNSEESDNFLYRLIAGLGKAFVITQAKSNSSCSKIINYALNDGKEIFAVPERIDSCFKLGNNLIKQGAKLVENVSDILNEL